MKGLGESSPPEAASNRSVVESLFLGALVALGGRTDRSAREAYQRLEDAYGEKARAYHNLRHIEKALETYLWLEEDVDSETSARALLALIYHDAVYDSKAKDNEAQSAGLAQRELEDLGVSASDREEIARMILLTREHHVSLGDKVGGCVVDADLAILQAPADEYDAYARAIRREYAWVSDEEYRAGRTRVLQGLLDRKLFVSRLLSEEAARENMRREIASLAD